MSTGLIWKDLFYFPQQAFYVLKYLVAGFLNHDELDQRALGALKDLDYDSAMAVINEMRGSNLQSVTNKSAYMCGLMKACRQKLAAGIGADADALSKPGPNAEKIKVCDGSSLCALCYKS